MTEGEALESFYQCHGDEDEWTPQEVAWHDILMERVRQEQIKPGMNKPKPNVDTQ